MKAIIILAVLVWSTILTESLLAGTQDFPVLPRKLPRSKINLTDITPAVPILPESSPTIKPTDIPSVDPIPSESPTIKPTDITPAVPILPESPTIKPTDIPSVDPISLRRLLPTRKPIVIPPPPPPPGYIGLLPSSTIKPTDIPPVVPIPSESPTIKSTDITPAVPILPRFPAIKPRVIPDPPPGYHSASPTINPTDTSIRCVLLLSLCQLPTRKSIDIPHIPPAVPIKPTDLPSFAPISLRRQLPTIDIPHVDHIHDPFPAIDPKDIDDRLRPEPPAIDPKDIIDRLRPESPIIKPIHVEIPHVPKAPELPKFRPPTIFRP